ncbi:ABC transporter permease [candidate division KSB1 bacterium]
MSENRINTPKFGKWLLFRFLDRSSRFDILGDFEEEFGKICHESNILFARLWYWGQVFRSIPAFIFRSAAWNIVLLNNYMKTSFRNLRRHKTYTAINIMGLAVGMAFSMVLLLWVRHDLGFDRFHEESENLYRINLEIEGSTGITRTATVPTGLGPTIENRFSEVLSFARTVDRNGHVPVTYGNNTQFGFNIFYTDSTFLEMFTFPLYKGDPKTALSGKNPIVITKSMSNKLLGGYDSIGKIVKIQREEFTITGIAEDPPSNSHIRFDCLMRLSTPSENISLENLYITVFGTYILVSNDCQVDSLTKKLNNSLKMVSPDIGQAGMDIQVKRIGLQPLKDIYFGSEGVRYDHAVTGDLNNLYLVGSLAFLLMLVTCINFINLSTLSSLVRAKEVGLRKIIGARRKNLLRQFFSESLLIYILSFALSIIIVKLVLPLFNNISGRELSLSMILRDNNISILSAAVFLTATISGFYPAVFLSSFKPLKLLKNFFRSGAAGGLYIRRLLVVFQFTISAVLILGTASVYRQMDFVRTKNLGFNKENLLVIGFISDHIRDIEPVIEKLLENPDVLNVAVGPRPIYHLIGTASNIQIEGSTQIEKIDFQCYNVDHNYIDTYEMELVAGRNFSSASEEDLSNYILNEEASRALGIRSPVGTEITIDGKRGKIIGIVKNFHHSSLHNVIQPVVFRQGNSKAVNVRYSEEKEAEALAYIKAVFEEAVPGFPYDHIFLEDTLNEFYNAEGRIGTILRYISIAAIFIACLGLYGLTAFSAERRTREIGIRKVLGASVFRIVRLVSIEFTILVLIANLLAIPVTYYLMKKWLQNFAYKTAPGLDLMLISGFAVIVTAVLAVGYQAFKAAGKDPVESIKYE